MRAASCCTSKATRSGQVYQRARAPGTAAELPVRAVLQQKEVPVDVYWAP